MVHQAASTGYELRSETYQQSRPSYHPGVLNAVAAAIKGRLVIDLGAGTGISTAALVQRGLAVTAVEPVAAMRETLMETAPTATVIEGTAEAIPIESSSVGSVVVAQAFHWFDHGPALDEIVRVLETDGRLVTLWNVRDESVPWMAAYTAIQDRVQGNTPRYRDMAWRRAIEQDERFVLDDEVRIANPQPSNPTHTIGRFLSTSFIASLSQQHQDELVAEIQAMVNEFGPEFDFPYWSEAQIWRRAA